MLYFLQKKYYIYGVFFYFFLSFFEINAQESPPSIIRDAEIEETIREFMAPLLETAALSIDSLRLFILNSPDVNAAAGSGVTLFLNTGLIEKAKNVDQLIGVLAHETGHMAGGHVARFEESYNNANAIALGLSLVGLAAGALLQQGDLAIASLLGGQHVGMRSLLQYSRAQESSADQAGAGYLKALGWPLQGSVEFLETLYDREDHQNNAYNQTHPLTLERMNALKSLVGAWQGSMPLIFEERFQRMKAKILAYEVPKRALRVYKGKTPLDKYAQSIAYLRTGKPEKALNLAIELVNLFPNDPYFYELKGQIFQQGSSIEQAVESYTMAVKLLPKNGLLRIDLGRLLLLYNLPATDKQALKQFEEAKKTQEIDNPFLWRQLSIGYRRQNNFAMAQLCLAQEAVLQNNKEKAHHHADQALKHFKKSDPGYIKASDIKNIEF